MTDFNISLLCFLLKKIFFKSSKVPQWFDIFHLMRFCTDSILMTAVSQYFLILHQDNYSAEK